MRHDAEWLHTDPWRVLRIQGEFVEGFDALAETPKAVTIFGSARMAPHSPEYRLGEELGTALVRAGYAVITDLGINFRYYFARKTMFVKYAQAFSACPADSLNSSSFRKRHAIIGSIADRGTSTCNAPVEAGNNTPWSKKKITPSLTTAKF